MLEFVSNVPDPICSSTLSHLGHPPLGAELCGRHEGTSLSFGFYLGSRGGDPGGRLEGPEGEREIRK